MTSLLKPAAGTSRKTKEISGKGVPSGIKVQIQSNTGVFTPDTLTVLRITDDGITAIPTEIMRSTELQLSIGGSPPHNPDPFVMVQMFVGDSGVFIPMLGEDARSLGNDLIELAENVKLGYTAGKFHRIKEDGQVTILKGENDE